MKYAEYAKDRSLCQIMQIRNAPTSPIHNATKKTTELYRNTTTKIQPVAKKNNIR